MDGDPAWHDLEARQSASPDHAGAVDWLRDVESAAFVALRAGTAGDGAAVLDGLCCRWPGSARLHWLHALLLREDQQHEAALKAISGAGDDAQARALLAQLRYESGRAAAADFARARALAPGDAALIRSHAGALAAEGESGAALTLMRQTLADRPDWVEGHSYAATLHRLLGAPGRDDAGFAQACQAQPHNLALRLGWFHGLAKAKDWDAARAVIADGVRLLGDVPALLIARLYLAAESGEADDRPDLFDNMANRTDAGLALASVRHALRCGAPDRAAIIAHAQTATSSASLFWPYLSLCWRLLGDSRADWLDRPDRLIRVTTLDLDYAALADLLRSLHNAAAPYPDQSVRGGTQTDRPLLFRQEPIIQNARAAIEAAVRDYMAALPPPEPGHPLLGTPRGEVKFAGSWSVRLGQQGYHAAHSHPAGWISSALYVALPDAMGTAPEGWLRFGMPPPELGLDLPPYRDVLPQVGQLVLFPSTLWHGTIPFEDGERLSIAFDIRAPRR
ncbi:2OG-Fe(II) oxygenase family protein [Sphingobium sp. AS12]|uniref:2OG-Fe(II) oxygenase family protein n=1 Tax=Sphingobium sp. AS12 TaxID=2849495 RepID=UPI001C317DD5|nr:2OG-Fe(II) oxygenase family protein [Sphingobium sp. AS12]MBV2147992.1 2OG-Fe(II) oxygenase family protein [Sphingobium sp. AS12]